MLASRYCICTCEIYHARRTRTSYISDGSREIISPPPPFMPNKRQVTLGFSRKAIELFACNFFFPFFLPTRTHCALRRTSCYITFNEIESRLPRESSRKNWKGITTDGGRGGKEKRRRSEFSAAAASRGLRRGAESVAPPVHRGEAGEKKEDGGENGGGRRI